MIPLEQGRNLPRAAPTDPSGGADSGVLFGAAVLILMGVFQAIQGVAAIANDDFFAADPTYAFETDPTVWGWIHLGFGVLLVIGGIYLFKGSKTAGIIAIVLAGLSAIANFLFIPHYPFWGLIILFVDLWIIWAIAASGVLSSNSELEMAPRIGA